MTTHGSLDRESFQKFLASAFAVQECQLDTQSLSAIVEIQRLISSGDLDLDAAMDLIVERTRNVANATGVAIGLLEGNQLTYRAGSGSAAAYTGRHVMAAISATAGARASREILRVENAQNDARIEGAICRQFGAQALLMLLIHHRQAVAGVMEILFQEPHAFQDHEVRSYQLMAQLAGDAISQAIQLDRKRALAAESRTLPHAMEQTTSLVQASSIGGSEPGFAHSGAIIQFPAKDDLLAAPLPAFTRAVRALAMIGQRLKDAPRMLHWQVSVSLAVLILVLAGWVVYRDHRSATAPEASALQGSNVLKQQTPASASTSQANSTPEAQGARVGTKAARSESAFRLVRVAEDEIDYVAEDVTIRYLGQKSVFPRVRRGYKQFKIGDDVTVRYFAPKMQPVASAAQPAERSLPASEKSVPAKLTQSN